MEITPRLLAEHPFFKNLDDVSLELIAPLAAAERFEDAEDMKLLRVLRRPPRLLTVSA